MRGGSRGPSVPCGTQSPAWVREAAGDLPRDSGCRLGPRQGGVPAAVPTPCPFPQPRRPQQLWEQEGAPRPTFQEWAALPDSDGPCGPVLAQGQLHQEEGQPHDEQHDEEGDEEDTWEEMGRGLGEGQHQSRLPRGDVHDQDTCPSRRQQSRGRSQGLLAPSWGLHPADEFPMSPTAGPELGDGGIPPALGWGGWWEQHWGCSHGCCNGAQPVWCSGLWDAQDCGMLRAVGCSGLWGVQGGGMLRAEGMLRDVGRSGPWDVQGGEMLRTEGYSGVWDAQGHGMSRSLGCAHSRSCCFLR